MYEIISTFDDLPKYDMPSMYPNPAWMSSFDGDKEFTIFLKDHDFRKFVAFSFMAHTTGRSSAFVNVKAMLEDKLVVEWEFPLSGQNEWLAYRLPYDIVEDFKADRLIFSFTFSKKHCVIYLGRLVIMDEDAKHGVLQAIKEAFHHKLKIPFAEVFENVTSNDSNFIRVRNSTLRFRADQYIPLLVGDKILTIDSLEVQEEYTDIIFKEPVFPYSIDGVLQSNLLKGMKIFICPASDFADLTDEMSQVPFFHINHGAMVDGDSEPLAVAKPIKFPKNIFLKHSRYVVKNLSLQINLYGNNNDLLELMWQYLLNVFSDFKRFLVGTDFVDYSILGYQANKPDDTVEIPTYSYDLNFMPYSNSDYEIGRTYDINRIELEVEEINGRK